MHPGSNIQVISQEEGQREWDYLHRSKVGHHIEKTLNFDQQQQSQFASYVLPQDTSRSYPPPTSPTSFMRAHRYHPYRNNPTERELRQYTTGGRLEEIDPDDSSVIPDYLKQDNPGIDCIRMRLFTANEIQKLSVVKVKHGAVQDKNVSKKGGVSDHRMGSVDHRILCGTCGKKIEQCTGHSGHIELPFPLYHVGFLETIVKILRMVCHWCCHSFVELPKGSPHPPPPSPGSLNSTETTGLPTSGKINPKKHWRRDHWVKRLSTMTGKRIKSYFSWVSSVCKGKKFCPVCELPQPGYNKNGTVIKIDWPDECRQFCVEKVGRNVTGYQPDGTSSVTADAGTSSSFAAYDPNVSGQPPSDTGKTKGKRGTGRRKKKHEQIQDIQVCPDCEWCPHCANCPVRKARLSCVDCLLSQSCKEHQKALKDKPLSKCGNCLMHRPCRDHKTCHQCDTCTECTLCESCLTRRHMRNVIRRKFTSLDAKNILKHVSDQAYREMGFEPEFSRPDDMIPSVLYVAPPMIRPSISVSDGSRARGHDDLTHKLQDIIRASNQLKKLFYIQRYGAGFYEAPLGGLVEEDQKGKGRKKTKGSPSSSSSQKNVEENDENDSHADGDGDGDDDDDLGEEAEQGGKVKKKKSANDSTTTTGMTKTESMLLSNKKQVKMNDLVEMRDYSVKVKGAQELPSIIDTPFDHLTVSPEDLEMIVWTEELDLALETLQFHWSTYVDNDIRGQTRSLQRSGASQKTFEGRMKGKEGRIRSNLCGKRSDFTSRTVITPDPNVEIDEIGVPESLVKILTKPQRVTPMNYWELTRRVREGPGSLYGAQTVIPQHMNPDGTREGDGLTVAGRSGEIIHLDSCQKRSLIELNNGDIVERTLKLGDHIVFNRQPSLHRPSMMGHKVRPMKGNTFRMNYSVCAPYNADFDGDEMNLHVPQDEQSSADVQFLMSVINHIVSPQSNKPIIPHVQDTLVGSFLLSQRSVFLNHEQMMDVMMYIKERPTRLPHPAIMKPIRDAETGQVIGMERLWTGKQVFSMLLPDITIRKLVRKEEISDDVRKGDTAAVNLCDNYVQIVKGEFLTGTLCKDTIGACSGGIIHILTNDYGGQRAAQFISDMQRVVGRMLMRRGFSVGVSDCMIPRETQRKIDIIAARIKAKIQKACQDLESLGEPLHQIEPQVNKVLNQGLDYMGRTITSLMGIHNQLHAMPVSGAKGKGINVTQVTAGVGQQTVRGDRIRHQGDPEGKKRTLPCYQDSEQHNIEAKGFVKNSFLRGLNNREFFFHAMGGKEGLVMTAVGTANTGYTQRRLMKAMEYLKALLDLTIRDSDNAIIQFIYGRDGMDPIHLEKCNLPFLSMSNQEIQEQFGWTLDMLLSCFPPAPAAAAAAEQRVKEKNGSKKRTRDDRKAEDDEGQQDIYWLEWELTHLCALRDAMRQRKVTILTPELDTSCLIPKSIHRVLEYGQQRYRASNSADVVHPSFVARQLYRYSKKMLKKTGRDGSLPTRSALCSVLNSRVLCRESQMTKEGVIWMLDKVWRNFQVSLVQSGEMVGPVAAQSMGEPCTQMSVDWQEKILIHDSTKNRYHLCHIGEWVDLQEDPGERGKAFHRTYAPNEQNYHILSVSSREKVQWKRIQGITRHEPGGHLVHVRTRSGRSIRATLAKSFLTRQRGRVVATKGSDLKVGDHLPVNWTLEPRTDNDSVGSRKADLKFSSHNAHYLQGVLWGAWLALCRDKDAEKQELTLANSLFRDDIAARFWEEIVVEALWTLNSGSRDLTSGFLLPCDQPTSASSPGGDAKNFLPDAGTRLIRVASSFPKESAESRHMLCGLLQSLFAFRGTRSSDAQRGDHQSVVVWDLRDSDLTLLGVLCSMGGRETTFDILQPSTPTEKDLTYVALFSACLLEKVTASEDENNWAWIWEREELPGRPSLQTTLADRHTIPGMCLIEQRGGQKSEGVLWTDDMVIEEKELAQREDRVLDVDELTQAEHRQVFWDEIVSIDRVESSHEFVYDLTVEDTNTFCLWNGLQCFDTLNTFHLAGIANKNAQQGVPRLKELIDVSKNLKTPSLTIFLTAPYQQPEHGATARAEMKNTLGHTVLTDVVLDTRVISFSMEEREQLWKAWVEGLKEKNDNPHGVPAATMTSMDELKTLMAVDCVMCRGHQEDGASDFVMQFHLNRDKMLGKGLTPADVSTAVGKYTGNHAEIISSEEWMSEWFLFVRLLNISNFTNPPDPASTTLTKAAPTISAPQGLPPTSRKENQVEKAIIEKIQMTLMNRVSICGIPGIQGASLRQVNCSTFDEVTGEHQVKKEWIIDTMGTALKEIMKLEGIDWKKTFSNDVAEVTDLFGIEAGAQLLFHEIRTVLSGDGNYIDERHIMLLVDTMTHWGYLMPVNRRGINKIPTGFFGRAAFEETTDVLYEATTFYEKDDGKGVTQSIMTGQRAPVGTGTVHVYPDPEYVRFCLKKHRTKSPDTQSTFYPSFNTTRGVIQDQICERNGQGEQQGHQKVRQKSSLFTHFANRDDSGYREAIGGLGRAGRRVKHDTRFELKRSVLTESLVSHSQYSSSSSSSHAQPGLFSTPALGSTASSSMEVTYEDMMRDFLRQQQQPHPTQSDVANPSKDDIHQAQNKDPSLWLSPETGAKDLVHLRSGKGSNSPYLEVPLQIVEKDHSFASDYAEQFDSAFYEPPSWFEGAEMSPGSLNSSHASSYGGNSHQPLSLSPGIPLPPPPPLMGSINSGLIESPPNPFFAPSPTSSSRRPPGEASDTLFEPHYPGEQPEGNGEGKRIGVLRREDGHPLCFVPFKDSPPGEPKGAMGSDDSDQDLAMALGGTAAEMNQGYIRTAVTSENLGLTINRANPLDYSTVYHPAEYQLNRTSEPQRIGDSTTGHEAGHPKAVDQHQKQPTKAINAPSLPFQPCTLPGPVTSLLTLEGQKLPLTSPASTQTLPPTGLPPIDLAGSRGGGDPNVSHSTQAVATAPRRLSFVPSSPCRTNVGGGTCNENTISFRPSTPVRDLLSPMFPSAPDATVSPTSKSRSFARPKTKTRN